MSNTIDKLTKDIAQALEACSQLPDIEAEIKAHIMKYKGTQLALNRIELELGGRDKVFRELIIKKEYLNREYLLNTQRLRFLDILLRE